MTNKTTYGVLIKNSFSDTNSERGEEIRFLRFIVLKAQDDSLLADLSPFRYIALSPGVVEYTDCFSANG